MRKKLIFILVATLLSCPAAFAQTDDATLIKADAMIKEGKAADAFALLEPLEAKLAGNATYDYLLATAALQAGNPSRATFIYERILALNPEFIGVRAEIGRA
jgi:tetratricopeptide (TPR) repeat protein